MKYHSFKVAFSCLLFSVSSSCSLQTVLLASVTHTFMNVPRPLGKLLYEDQRELGGHNPVGSPLCSNCLWNCKPGCRRETVWRQRGGGAHSSSLCVSKPVAFQAEMQLKSDAWTAHTVRRGHALAVHWFPLQLGEPEPRWGSAEESLHQALSATSLCCCARGSSMVLRLLLLLAGLLRATKPAPRCETGQETLGKANHP